MERWKLCGSALAILALLLYPETTLNAAREAMRAWYMSVAPSLFPFMALMPALTAPSAAAVWERLLGRWMRPLLNLPGSAAPAVVVGMIAGSPAGAAAAARCPGLTRSELERLVCCVCGLSPAFLITGVGASMLGSPADGRLLLRAQVFSQLAMLAFTRGAKPDAPALPPDPAAEESPVRAAVTGVLTVCGYMMLFSVLGALAARLLRSETAGLTALCLLDMPSGARALSTISMRREPKLLLLAAMTGFGGLCIASQNLAACRKSGVRAGKYILSRLSHAMLCTGFAALQLRLNARGGENPLPPMEFSALFAAIFAVPALISLKKDLFLNKRNSAKLDEF